MPPESSLEYLCFDFFHEEKKKKETKIKISVYEWIIVALWNKILLQKNQNPPPSPQRVSFLVIGSTLQFFSTTSKIYSITCPIQLLQLFALGVLQT